MSNKYISTARAHSNIAFIKYWGNQDHKLRLASNPSISMNLRNLHTTTQVEWSPDYTADSLILNQQIANPPALLRVSNHLQLIRQRLSTSLYARVTSINNFPMGTGIASSASSFAALTLAATSALGESLSEKELSTIARCGSGSASRSIPSGYVEWYAGQTHETSYAETFVDYDYWDLVDVIAIVSHEHKKTGSYDGHATADTSVLQNARISSAGQRLEHVKKAIEDRDFEQFADIVEEDSNIMHAVMMTSRPPLMYWNPLSLVIMNAVHDWRKNDGLQVCYTLDAGPNVHCICIRKDKDAVISKLSELSDDIDIRVSDAGQGAHLVSNSEI